MQKYRRKTGTVYEQAVGYYLEQQGYEILVYNYRCRFGEIDLIGKDGEYLVFCEVKYRKNQRKGSPLDAVDKKKQQKIIQCAKYDLLEHQAWGISCRFDVIGIDGSRLIHIENAFEC